MSGDILGQTSIEELLPAAVRTSTATGTGVDIKDYVGRAKVILASAVATAGDTLDVKLQESDVLGSGYADITGAAFTQVTAAADSTEAILIDCDATKRYVRAIGTIAGDGSESFSFAVVLVGLKQVR